MRTQTRRLLIAVFVAVLLAAPFASETQQAGKLYRVGYLSGHTYGPFFESVFGTSARVRVPRL
jgi:hypothetical protein